MMFWFLASFLLHIVLFWRVPVIQRDCNPRHFSNVRKTSVIIPARNEENNLPNLLNSIQRQEVQPMEIIVVNDGSTDRTKEIALRKGVRVIDAPPIEHGWQGKSWACWQGANAANGDYLLFIDADAWFEDGGLLRIMGAYQQQLGKGIMTIHPYHKIRDWYEVFSSIFHLVTFASIGSSNIYSTPNSLSGGFGQFLYCRSFDYFKIGGHREIRSAVVENMELAKLAKSKNESISAWSGKDAVSMRMYPNGKKEMIYGWSKSFFSGALQTNPINFLLIVFWITASLSFIFSGIGTLFSEPILVLLCIITYIWALTLSLRKIGNFHFMDLLLFPLHLLAFVGIFFYSIYLTFFTKSSTWKGRSIITSKEKEENLE
ncbi:glycosyltransferase [Falsibacillus albus]|uniref:4,4'-diaponeurosporenoate glycosyltransferase n=1 Tax=Falsibacillus albus TaxID=2478915 RepID=A0A3L7JXJ4_9BACI|nr:glycosyltransferase family 2 protein [Falsibacillus albus]RLQ95496.1 glycosyltransferase family 2 protein [Falsibacillus albus]